MVIHPWTAACCSQSHGIVRLEPGAWNVLSPGKILSSFRGGWPPIPKGLPRDLYVRHRGGCLLAATKWVAVTSSDALKHFSTCSFRVKFYWWGFSLLCSLFSPASSSDHTDSSSSDRVHSCTMKTLLCIFFQCGTTIRAYKVPEKCWRGSCGFWEQLLELNMTLNEQVTCRWVLQVNMDHGLCFWILKDRLSFCTDRLNLLNHFKEFLN